MIRYRLPQRDDKYIHSLVIKELLPYSYVIRKHSSPDFKKIRADIQKKLCEGTTLVVVNRKKEAFGFIHFITQGNRLYMNMLAVSSVRQGKGWGARLLQSAEHIGKAAGCSTALLFVDLANVKAQRFYARKGYLLQSFHPEIQCCELVKLI